MLQTILLVILCLICVTLIGVVLMQRSEGGALGMGGSTGSILTARGAGDLLTRITWILGVAFFVLSLIITILSGFERRATSVVDRVDMNKLGVQPKLNIAPQPGDAQPPASSQPAQSGAPPLPDAAPPPLPDAAPAPAPTSAPRPAQ